MAVLRMWNRNDLCAKSVRIRSYSGPCFPAFGLNTERYEVICGKKDRNNSEYGHVFRSDEKGGLNTVKSTITRHRRQKTGSKYWRIN